MNSKNSVLYNPYKLTHAELGELIRKESQKLQELKRLYKKEQQILGNIKSQKFGDMMTTKMGKNVQSSISNKDFIQSPIKILSMTPIKQSDNQFMQYSQTKDSYFNFHINDISSQRRYQYEESDDENQVFNSQKSKKIKVQKQNNQERIKLNQIQKRLINIQLIIDEKNKNDLKVIRNHQFKQKQKISLQNNKQQVKQNTKNSLKRKIVYDQIQNSDNQGKKITNQFKPIAVQQIKQRQVYKSIKSKSTINQSKKRQKSQKSIISLRQTKSSLNMKGKSHKKSLSSVNLLLDSKLIQRNKNLSIKNQSEINKLISNRLVQVGCVFKHLKQTKLKNQTHFIFNKYQGEVKARKQIIKLINFDPSILKKHNLIVN